jgi:hypothetical protein
LTTTLSSQVQSYTAVRGTLYAAVQNNTATVPLYRGFIQRSLLALPIKMQGAILRISHPITASTYRLRLTAPLRFKPNICMRTESVYTRDGFI